MKLFRDLPIRGKLMVLMTLSSTVALCIAFLAWSLEEARVQRDARAGELQMMAELVGDSSVAGLVFQDDSAVQADLEVLGKQPGIRRTFVCDSAGALVATTDPERPLPELDLQEDAAVDIEDGLRVVHGIRFQGERIGTVVIESDLSGRWIRRISFLGTIAAVMAVCLVMAIVVSYWLQRVISVPVKRLAGVVKEISESKDFGLRAEPTGRDEFGYLTEAFNGMLEEIQRRDVQLEHQNNMLEVEVALRTQELLEKNEELEVSVDEARQAAVAKAQFLANMSHEIRTPMNGVLGMNELLLGSPLGDKEREYAELVQTSARALLGIIDDILDFSKIEAGKLRLEELEFELARPIEDVVRLLAENAHAKGLELEHEVAPSAPEIVRGDPMRLRQIVMNLVGNAIKFTREGRISVRVEGVSRSGHAHEVRISVQDTGIGIPEDRLAQLFDCFAQVDASTTREFGGTGLGLAICKQLAELMGGSIEVDTTLGKGSTFRVTLPLEKVGSSSTAGSEPATSVDEPAAPLPSDTPPVSGAERPEQPLRILLAEDNPINQTVVQRILSRRGYRCALAVDGQGAFEAVRDEDYDLVLMDCQMPGVSGYEATERIREHERATGARPVHILALTANAMQGDRERCLAAGMDDYLAKPIRSRALLERVDAIAERAPRGSA